MLKTIKIRGFKSIVNAQIELGRVNLFIGANGAGKSNILEAIGLLSAGLSRDITGAELQRKGVRLSVPTLFKSTFKNHKLRVNFDLEAQLEQDVHYAMRLTASETHSGLRFSTETIKQAGKTYLRRSNRGIRIAGRKTVKADVAPERGLWDRFRELGEDLPTALNEELNTLAKFCIYTPQTPFLRGTEIETVPTEPLGLYGGNLAQASNYVFQKFNQNTNSIEKSLIYSILDLIWIPGWADEARVGNIEPDKVSSQVKTAENTLYFHDKFMKKGRDFLSAYDSSEGSLYLLFLATLVLHEQSPKIFALDNVDNALNPKATRHFLEKLITVCCQPKYQSLRTTSVPQQVFLTSHNPSALDAFDLFDPQQKIFIVSRDKQGFTQIEPLQVQQGISKAEWIQIREGKNLSEMWLNDLIPNALGASDL
ncbi:AAA family ATPase [Candidatus Venteria ishoeyi]|nr:ATP-binding protein [Candidatus Venteria ishoeyi]